MEHFTFEKKQSKIYQLCVSLGQYLKRWAKLETTLWRINMLRFVIIIIEYLETTLLQSRYAKIDGNYHRLSYPMIIITHHKHNPQ